MMIIDPSTKADESEMELSSNAASSSEQPPPSFEEASSSSAHLLVTEDQPLLGASTEEPPPDFAPYDAAYQIDKQGNIISHDSHLNEDGEALYRFLLAHTAEPPNVVVKCQGWHNENRVRYVTHQRRGPDGREHSVTHHEVYEEKVTDFAFSINVTQYIVHGPVHWSTPNAEPTYRGKWFTEIIDDLGEQKSPKPKARRAARKWQKSRKVQGLAPWAASPQDAATPISGLRSSKTLREWADDYCASDKIMKEFVYEKVVYGWNFQNLETAIIHTIKSTPYVGQVSVSFDTTGTGVVVRSSGLLARWMDNGWIKFLLIITLIYPIILLFRRFHSRGGGRWTVCGGAYALRASVSDGSKVSAIGMREGEWFRLWENPIRRAVTSGLKSQEPLLRPEEPVGPGMFLDGY
ncbi:hypothetical protein SISNIDRAFT_483424 [Sistotremastrum niveocremeum HHB9708]|uniref:Uncharacterized protein n=1 Tax=Sistotremastrum niveocremeum HHB9708 TaxID=1314777 RepID=A0A164XIM2_9AGAM|nr:hypothetical protein SISNIDRAFT_483424 [Sistotremastrum niveocremeum HHB9708]